MKRISFWIEEISKNHSITVTSSRPNVYTFQRRSQLLDCNRSWCGHGNWIIAVRLARGFFYLAVSCRTTASIPIYLSWSIGCVHGSLNLLARDSSPNSPIVAPRSRQADAQLSPVKPSLSWPRDEIVINTSTVVRNYIAWFPVHAPTISSSLTRSFPCFPPGHRRSIKRAHYFPAIYPLNPLIGRALSESNVYRVQFL